MNALSKAKNKVVGTVQRHIIKDPNKLYEFFIKDVSNDLKEKGESQRVQIEEERIKSIFESDKNTERHKSKKLWGLLELMCLHQMGLKININVTPVVASLLSTEITKPSEKRVAYLAISMFSLKECEQELYNSLVSDLSSESTNEECNLALSFISSNYQLKRELKMKLVPHVIQSLTEYSSTRVTKLTHKSKPTLFQKGCLCLLSMFREFPELLLGPQYADNGLDSSSEVQLSNKDVKRVPTLKQFCVQCIVNKNIEFKSGSKLPNILVEYLEATERAAKYTKLIADLKWNQTPGTVQAYFSLVMGMISINPNVKRFFTGCIYHVAEYLVKTIPNYYKHNGLAFMYYGVFAPWTVELLLRFIMLYPTNKLVLDNAQNIAKMVDSIITHRVHEQTANAMINKTFVDFLLLFNIPDILLKMARNKASFLRNNPQLGRDIFSSTIALVDTLECITKVLAKSSTVSPEIINELEKGEELRWLNLLECESPTVASKILELVYYWCLRKSSDLFWKIDNNLLTLLCSQVNSPLTDDQKKLEMVFVLLYMAIWQSPQETEKVLDATATCAVLCKVKKDYIWRWVLHLLESHQTKQVKLFNDILLHLLSAKDELTMERYDEFTIQGLMYAIYTFSNSKLTSCKPTDIPTIFQQILSLPLEETTRFFTLVTFARLKHGFSELSGMKLSEMNVSQHDYPDSVEAIKKKFSPFTPEDANHLNALNFGN